MRSGALASPGAGPGRFAEPAMTLLAAGASGAFDVAIADLDGDERLDVVLVGRDQTLLHRGDSERFASESQRVFPVDSRMASMADLDRDGALELVLGA